LFHDLLALILVEQMNGLSRNDGWYRTVGRVNGHPLANELLRIPAANRIGVDISVVVDMSDDKADLVGVTGEHHAHLCIGVAAGDHVAVQVGSHVVGKFADIAPHDFLHGLLVAGGTRSFENLLKKLLRGLVHDCGTWFHCLQTK
jgi:hypothetical protein